MISIEQITGEIAALEEQVPTYVVMQKLANLYTVRDHMGIVQETPPVISEPNKIPELGMSDFLQTIVGKDLKFVIAQIDEAMSTIQVLNPRLYDGIMRKLNE